MELRATDPDTDPLVSATFSTRSRNSDVNGADSGDKTEAPAGVSPAVIYRVRGDSCERVKHNRDKSTTHNDTVKTQGGPGPACPRARPKSRTNTVFETNLVF